MDTREFLATVLPDEGWRCCVAISPTGRVAQSFSKRNEELTKKLHQIDSRNINAYHACATYVGRDGRTADKVAYLQSFWMDLDVGDHKAFADRKSAASALTKFCGDTGLPMPLVILSGSGLHCYFLIEEPVTLDEWQPIADALKAACAALGFPADPSRTSDAASILRPAGTRNWKDPKNPQVVKRAGGYELKRLPASSYRDILSGVVTVAAEGLGPVPDHLQGGGDNADLTGGMEVPESSAHKIADKCAIINEVRESKGNVEEPLWYHALGVLNRTIEAPDICHEWSKGHPAYSKGETTKKLAQLDTLTGATMCETLGQHRPDACKKCELYGKGSSPVRLGMVEPEVEVEHIEPSGQKLVRSVRAPEGFKFEKQGGAWYTLAMTGKDEDGNALWDVMTDNIIVPAGRIDTDEGFDIRFEAAFSKDKPARHFIVPAGTIAAGGAELFKEVGKHEIMVEAKMKPKFESYLRRWTVKQREDTDAIKAYSSLGWQDDKSFVLGEERLIANQPPEKVVLTVPASNYGSNIHTKGDYATWKNAVDRAYNTLGQEAIQFLVLCGFASPLLKLFEEFGGVTVFAYSEDTGHGKTSTQNTALSIWGKVEELDGMDGQATDNAMWKKLSALSNLPYVIDELTNKDAQGASKLVYTISGGTDRDRLDASGQLRAKAPKWSTITMASGNVSLGERIALHRSNVKAELARLFEFNLPPIVGLSKNDADVVLPQIVANYGHAGREYAQYLVDNYDDVKKMLMSTRKQVQDKFGMDHRERFWAALISCVLVSQLITRKLGILQFPVPPMVDWVGRTLGLNRATSRQTVRSSDEIMADMLNHMIGDTLTTEGQGNAKSGGYANVIHEPRTGRLRVRVILAGVNNSERSAIYIPANEVKEWCAQPGTNISPRRLAEDGKAHGWLIQQDKRYRLGQGTKKYGAISGQVRCWVVDPHRFAASTGSVPTAMQRAQLVGDQGLTGSDK